MGLIYNSAGDDFTDRVSSQVPGAGQGIAKKDHEYIIWITHSLRTPYSTDAEALKIEFQVGRGGLAALLRRASPLYPIAVNIILGGRVNPCECSQLYRHIKGEGIFFTKQARERETHSFGEKSPISSHRSHSSWSEVLSSVVVITR